MLVLRLVNSICFLFRFNSSSLISSTIRVILVSGAITFDQKRKMKKSTSGVDDLIKVYLPVYRGFYLATLVHDLVRASAESGSVW